MSGGTRIGVCRAGRSSTSGGLAGGARGAEGRGGESAGRGPRDRLARDVLTAAFVDRLCERAGARVDQADGTGNGTGPEAQFLRSVSDAFAAYERALIRARMKAALAVKKAKGEGPPSSVRRRVRRRRYVVVC